MLAFQRNYILFLHKAAHSKFFLYKKGVHLHIKGAEKEKKKKKNAEEDFGCVERIFKEFSILSNT